MQIHTLTVPNKGGLPPYINLPDGGQHSLPTTKKEVKHLLRLELLDPNPDVNVPDEARFP